MGTPLQASLFEYFQKSETKARALNSYLSTMVKSNRAVQAGEPMAVKSEAPMPLDRTLRVSDLCSRFFPKYSSFHRLRSSSSF